VHRSISRILVPCALLILPAVSHSQVWGYLGDTGPGHWGELDPSFATCGSGSQQSPVNLGIRGLRARLVPHLQLGYGDTEGEIFSNGHTIEVETEGHNVLWLDGEEYELVQFHFHTPSEHTVSGRGWDMELHLVHRSASGALAVVGVFLKRSDSSGALGAIFEHLPNEVGVREPIESFNPARFLPPSRVHLRYAGSLTTPPCTEGVRWMVMLQPVTISDEDMAQFNERIRFNARPVQRP